MPISNYTPFSIVYHSFLSKITDDMYMELTKEDTYALLQELLMSAVHKFEFPRQKIQYITITEDEKGQPLQETQYFTCKLTDEQINILATYMIVEWIGQQLASVENVRMKYSGSDFKFTSQANHMQKLLQMKKDYEREGFHLQRLYKRRIKDVNGIYRPTMGDLMSGPKSYNVSSGGCTPENRPTINNVEILGDKTGKDYSLQDLLIAGNKIMITDNGDHTATISVVGGTGGGELEADLIVSNPIGKYIKDETIPEGEGFEAIFRGMLSKTYYPVLTDPSLNLVYNAPSLVRVGTTISALKATLNFNRGSINPQYTAESPYRAGQVIDYNILLSGASVEYSDSGINKEFNVPAFTKNTKGSVILKAEANYAAGVQPKDSDGIDYGTPLPAGSKSVSKTIDFILPFYYGVSDTFNIETFVGLTEDLSKKSNKVYNFTTDDQYMTIIYDSSYGDLTSILDANNFELIEGWTKTIKTIDGQSYCIWVSNGSTTDTNAQFTFKF